VRADFSLPLGAWTPMLVTPEFSLLAWPIPGLGDEQWISGVAVVAPEGESLVEVFIKTDLADANKTAPPSGAFKTLDVTLGPAGAPLRSVPSTTVTGVDSFVMEGVELAFGRIRNTRGREYVVIFSASANVAILSSSAREFYGERPELASRFAHLDLEFFDLEGPQSMGGVLPELWGLRPYSAKTSAMVRFSRRPGLGPELSDGGM